MGCWLHTCCHIHPPCIAIHLFPWELIGYYGLICVDGYTYVAIGYIHDAIFTHHVLLYTCFHGNSWVTMAWYVLMVTHVLHIHPPCIAIHLFTWELIGYYGLICVDSYTCVAYTSAMYCYTLVSMGTHRLLWADICWWLHMCCIYTHHVLLYMCCHWLHTWCHIHPPYVAMCWWLYMRCHIYICVAMVTHVICSHVMLPFTYKLSCVMCCHGHILYVLPWSHMSGGHYCWAKWETMIMK